MDQLVDVRPEYPGVREIFWTPRKVRKRPRAVPDLSFLLALLFAKPPSDPPDYAKVRAPRPPADPERYDSLTREDEHELIRAYHEDGDLDALDRLVGAHRPMVVRAAKSMWRGDVKLKALVEYGMLGLRVAAQPQRPSKSKKGETVGFDASKGFRFSTYARDYAQKEMQMAVSGRMVSGSDQPDILPDEFEHKTTATVEAWMALDDGDALLKDAKGVVRCLSSRQGLPPKCRRPIGLWSLGEPEPREVRLRSYLKHPRIARELANRDLEYRGCHTKLATYEEVAKDVFFDGDVPDLLDGDQSHALDPKLYKLPKEVLKQRHELGCKREGKITPYKSNKGLGLFDKFGARLRLPDYDVNKVTVKRNRPFTPFLGQPGLASTYSMRG